MSENKNYKITKTAPGTVLFFVHPVSNPMLTRLVTLDAKHPTTILPLDWALGVFADEEVYSLYKNQYFTFDDNDSIVKEAFDAGVYFDETLDFTPAEPDREEEIFAILQKGVRAEILKLKDKEGKDAIEAVAIARCGELTQNVIQLLENILNIQLTVDGQ